MPVVDKPLAELRNYFGISPKPADFDAFWDRALAELDATPPEPKLVVNSMIRSKVVSTFDLTFSGVGGALIYAKLYRPASPAPGQPAVLFFHGYSGNSGSWTDIKLALASQGITVAALDCRGQGGRSQDSGSVLGTTMNGHIIRGLSEGPEKLLFRQIFLDTVQLARIVMAMDGVNPANVCTWGGSQGGALSIACAALEPRIRRCVSVFPFLSDYRRVWEMDLDKDAYAELRTYLRHFDPCHERIDEMFERLGYIDIQNLAPRIRAEVLMGISLIDTICPPSTQFAVFNKIESPKTPVIYPDFGHEGLPGFDDRAFQFILDLAD
jgi:cephalosporin-C deacetylase